MEFRNLENGKESYDKRCSSFSRKKVKRTILNNKLNIITIKNTSFYNNNPKFFIFEFIELFSFFNYVRLKYKNFNEQPT